MPEPTKALILSAEDLPTLPGTPTVIDHDGEPHLIRSSRYVPAGQMYVVDLAALDLTTLFTATPANQ